MSEDQLNDRIIKIAHNTKKNQGNLRRYAVTQIPIENHQRGLVWKTHNNNNNNNNEKTLKFVHTIKWGMPKSDFLLENETHRILWDF